MSNGRSFLIMFLQLLEINVADLIAKGNYYISVREKTAKKLLDKVFKVRLGRGFYGECLVINYSRWNLIP